eukprot:853596-Pelagomonas_calceolata.AAC.1
MPKGQDQGPGGLQPPSHREPDGPPYERPLCRPSCCRVLAWRWPQSNRGLTDSRHGWALCALLRKSKSRTGSRARSRWRPVLEQQQQYLSNRGPDSQLKLKDITSCHH